MKIKQILASLVLLVGAAFGQGQFNGGGSPSGATGAPVTLGTAQFPTPTSVYQQPGFTGGTLIINGVSGTPYTYLFDLFQNRTLGTKPVVTTTTVCPGVGTFLTGSSTKDLAVQQVQQDSSGNTLWSPITEVTETTTASLCYTVTAQAYAAGGAGSGNSAGYQTIAIECNAPGPCATVAPTGAGNLMLANATLQNATAGVPATFFFGDNNATRTYNFTVAGGTVVSTFMPSMIPVPNNGGVLVRNTQFQIYGTGSSGSSAVSATVITFPTSFNQEDSITGNGRTTTIIQLSQSAPNGIPAFAVKSSILATGGATAETLGQSRSFVLALLDQGNVVSISPIQVTPAFSTGFAQAQINAPAPPYLPQTIQPTTRYLFNSRITDPNNVPSVWTVTTTGATSATQNGAGQPFGTKASSPCIVAGGVGVGTQVTDGTAVFRCIMQGTTWAQGTYTLGTEFYDSTALDAQGNATGGYIEVTVNNGGGATGANNPTPSNLCVGCVKTVAGGYSYTGLGLTTIVAPAFQIYSAAQAVTSGNQYGTTAPTLCTTGCTNPATAGNPLGTNFNWSSCSGTALVAVGVCGTGGGVVVFNDFKSAGHVYSGALPIPTGADFLSCPAGWICSNTIMATGWVARFVWVSATGISPPSGEQTGPAQGGANRAIRFPAPSNPPPNAVGWTIDFCAGTIGACRGREILQAVDGVNIVCAEPGGTPTNTTSYAIGLDHGAACGIGKDLMLMTALTFKPFTPIRNLSNIFMALGPMGQQSSAGIGFFAAAGSNTVLSCYSCRIDKLTLEMGRALNTQEPYGTVISGLEPQEGGGVGYDGGCVQVADGAQTGVYLYSNGAQNSGSNCIHYTGQNWDYTSAGILVTDIEAPRTFSNFSAMGPLQSTPWLSLTGLWLMSTPNANGPGTVGPQAASISIECEMAYGCVRIDGTTGTIMNVWSSSANARSAPHVVELGPWAFNVNVLSTRAAASSSPTVHECPLWNESPTLAAPGTACQASLDVPLANFWEGISSSTGAGGAGLPMCSSDPLIGCSKGLTGGVIGTGIGTAASPSVVTLSNPGAASGSFSCDAAATGATCTIAATQVTANSTIIVTNITAFTGLTCNAAADTALTKQRLLSQTAGVGFSINLGTFAATAECFNYWIIN